jgi:hypothetical protein
LGRAVDVVWSLQGQWMKSWYWMVLGLHLMFTASVVVAQQTEDSDPAADKTVDCSISVEDMERFRRTRQLNKNC